MTSKESKKEKGSVLEYRRFRMRNKGIDDATIKPIEQESTVTIFLKTDREGKSIESGPWVKAHATQRKKTKTVQGRRIKLKKPILELTFSEDITKRSKLVNNHGDIIPKKERGTVTLEPGERVTIVTPIQNSGRFTHFHLTYDELRKRMEKLGIIDELPEELHKQATEEVVKEKPPSQPEPPGSQPQNVVVYPAP
jgi:sulfur carrier protein ThiS